MIKWMDQRFSYWMADGPIPEKAPKFGTGHARAERIRWFRHFLSWMIGIALMYGMILYIGDYDSTEEIQKLIKWWSIVVYCSCNRLSIQLQLFTLAQAQENG
jgi:hypothetical protein